MGKFVQKFHKDRYYADDAGYSEDRYDGKDKKKKKPRKQKYYDDFEDTSRYEFKPQKVRY